MFLRSRPAVFYFFWIFVLSNISCYTIAQPTTVTIKWGTHIGPSSPSLDFYDGTATDPTTISDYYLQMLDGSGGTTNLADGTDGQVSLDSPLVQLGFFDTDGVNDSSYSPNNDGSSNTDLFKGLWTPLTAKTTIGQDWYSGTDVGAGLFFFETVFNKSGTHKDYARSNVEGSYGITTDSPTGLNDRYNALNDPSNNNTYIGIRFYDTDADTALSSSSRYNTIMNTSWKWPGGGPLPKFLLTDSGLEFEFDNTDAYTANISKVDTGDYQIPNNDFVTTITYFDGDETINVGDSTVNSISGIGSSIISGFDGTGRIFGGQDANVLTIHSAAGNTGADAYEFSGDFYRADSGTDSTDLTIIKTGTGDQILSGNLNLADSDNTSASGGLNISAGKLILKPASGTPNKQQTVEYLTGSGTLSLDNTGVSTDTIVTLGFANTSSSTFSGNVELSGGNTAHKISISSSATGYDKEQVIAGTITGDNAGKTLVKDGAGILTLHGDSSSSMTAGIQVENGTLVIGDGSDAGADPGTGTITINKGKLEIAASETIDNAINTANSGKSMLGGKGTLDRAVTIGSADDLNYVDVISPGSGISSSLSSTSSKQQVSLGDRANAIGTFTVSDTLTLENGGVYDWEITDFSGTASNTGAGSNWDLLMFDTLNFDSTTPDVFTINIMSLDANGDAGAMSGGNVWDNYTSNGFLFMKATGAGSGWTGTGSMGMSGLSSAGMVNAFDVNASGWSYYNSHHLNDWNVWYDGSGSFYLQYSVAPEPSTYVMVTGLMLVPGMNAVRKYRNRKKKQELEEPKEEIVS